MYVCMYIYIICCLSCSLSSSPSLSLFPESCGARWRGGITGSTSSSQRHPTVNGAGSDPANWCFIYSQLGPPTLPPYPPWSVV